VSRAETSVRVRARAPVRVDFAGGWSDVPVFARTEGGVVTNAAITRYVHVECTVGGGAIRLHAEDLKQRVVVRNPAELTYDGRLDLHKAALNMLPVTGGLELLTRADVPPGSGLGASGALDVALVAALATLRGEQYSRPELAELGFQLEARELKLAGGRQDQYAGALGGWHQLAFSDGGVAVHPIAPDAGRAAALAAMLVIAFTGESHFSSDTHYRVWDAYRAGRPQVVDALRRLRDLGSAAAAALAAGDWPALAAAVDENWRCQQLLDPTIATPAMVRVEHAARAAGATGIKATGAGAGGCLLILAPPERRPIVERVVQGAGAQVLPAEFDFTGVHVWQDDAPGDRG
jgi:D-glycero-alpha-D-manno-heptose-7-phosphate kinase